MYSGSDENFGVRACGSTCILGAKQQSGFEVWLSICLPTFQIPISILKRAVQIQLNNVRSQRLQKVHLEPPISISFVQTF